ncbi:MAG TPA: CHAP domain-containing protein [Solirubrobacteraceae bacterium]|nr:CHAP domain-containing protein [Solirubrobacteraceae bacterium]
MASSEADIAAQLIERLLGDPAFRTEFRRDPAAACRKAGLDELADEMAIGAGKAMMTLDQRESKSSLAGVMMAAAMEGVGIYQFGEHILPHLDDVPSAVGDVLSRVSLPAVDLKGALAGGADAPAAAPPAEAAGAGSNGAAEAGAPGGGGGGAAAAAEPPPEAAPPEEAAAAGKEAAAAKEATLPPEQAAAGKAAAKIAAAESPEAKREAEIDDAVEKIKEEAEDLPSANDLPDSGVAPKPIEEVGDTGHDHAGHDHGDEAAPAAAAQPAAAAPVAPPEAAAAQPAAAVDAASGSGGGGAAAEALLQNKNLVLDADAQKDIRDGAVDPRMIALLGKLTEKHKIELSVIKTGHGQFTSGGSVSNHFVGRGMDIARVDGEIVSPGSPAARELATEIAEMTGDLRPTEVGTPWAIGASGFFTDGGHQDHLHVAFDGEPPADFKAPAPSAPGAPAAAAGAPVASAAAVPGQPAGAAAALAEPKAKKSDSMSFRAITAEDAAAKPKKSDSIAFMEAVKPQPPAQPVAAAAAVDPTAAAGTGVPADLSGVPDAYPGDDASQPEIAAWMAKQAQDRGLPPELPLMASLVESGMKNLNFGDADSVGFFQMRVGIWNQGDYAGFPEDPKLQVKWFLDNAETVKKARIAAGKPIDDPNSFGEWIADVERPAEQYRGRYQLKLEEAQGLLEKAPQGNAATPAAAVAPAAVEPSGNGAAPVDQAQGGRSQKVDASQFGGEGSGGTPSPETLALLKNKNITFDDVGVKDLEAGKIDPRVVAVLTKLSEDHKLTISCMCSDHSKFTSGGSVSNHFHGRGVDIASVDGEIVNPGSVAARELATEMQEIAKDYRPDEIGSPWAISGPGYFTDAGHQDHVHLGFKTEIDPSWKPPADVAASGATPAAAAPAGAPAAVPAVAGAPAAAAAAVPGQPATPGEVIGAPKPKASDSISFKAVTAKDAADAAPKKTDSLQFMAVQPPAGPANFVAAPGAVPAAVADAAAATAAGGGGSGLGASALELAKKELAAGVKEEGTNTGAKVDEYLASAGVGPGNPWCASFVTWAMEKSGHKMPGSGWAAVQTWVRSAEAGQNNLEVVSAADARPGDIVAYDWGGQEDFASDGHIGFLASNVQDGKFTAVEGNYRDAVLSVPRQTTGANVKFIRIKGEAGAAAASPPLPPAAAPASGAAVMGALDDGSAQAKAEAAAGTAPPAAAPPAAAPPAAAPPAVAPPEIAAAAAAAPADPAAAEKAQAAAEGAASKSKKHGTLEFMAVDAKEAAAREKHMTVQFMKAVEAKPAGEGPVAAAAAAGSVAPPEVAAAAGGPDAPSAAEDAAANQAVGAPVPEGELALQNVGAIGTYPGDDATQAQLAQWLASEAHKAGLPPELPVMASLVESGVKNLKGGDADSAGFFQMRVGIWDNGPYKGFRMNPQLQAKWFIDNALAVKKARLAAGKSVTDPGSFGEWIADIERPAAQYRYKYQLRLTEARKLIGGR